MKNLFLTALVCTILPFQFALGAKKEIKYEYKKYEKFEFDTLGVDGSTGNPGDLSLGPRFERKYKNKLPERKNFNKEIRRSIQRIR